MTMPKLFLTLLAAAGIGLAGAPVASASEDAFVKAIDSLDYYAIDCPGCAQDALDVGYRVCKAFDSGGESAAIAEVLRSYNGPDQTNPNYYATLFAQYSAYELCPQHDGEIGQIQSRPEAKGGPCFGVASQQRGGERIAKTSPSETAYIPPFGTGRNHSPGAS